MFRIKVHTTSVIHEDNYEANYSYSDETFSSFKYYKDNVCVIWNEKIRSYHRTSSYLCTCYFHRGCMLQSLGDREQETSYFIIKEKEK